MPAQHRAGLADGHLAPDFKTIADFRKDNGEAIREVCRTFVALCRELDLPSVASVAIDGCKFKAVNARDKNFTEAKMKRRLERLDESIARYIAQLETADRRGDAVPEARVLRFKDKIAKLRDEIARLSAINAEMVKSEDKQISLTDPDARSMATSASRSRREPRWALRRSMLWLIAATTRARRFAPARRQGSPSRCQSR